MSEAIKNFPTLDGNSKIILKAVTYQEFFWGHHFQQGVWGQL